MLDANFKIDEREAYFINRLTEETANSHRRKQKQWRQQHTTMHDRNVFQKNIWPTPKTDPDELLLNVFFSSFFSLN